MCLGWSEILLHWKCNLPDKEQRNCTQITHGGFLQVILKSVCTFDYKTTI